MRRCKACGRDVPLDLFPTYRAKGVVGRRHTCRECWNSKWNPIIAAHGKRYYHNNTNGYRDRQKARSAKSHVAAGREVLRSRVKAYTERYPEKAAAKQAVMIALRSGRLLRRPCVVCGTECVQAHHDDYSRPLDVIWLCRLHHGERHRLLNRRLPPESWPAEWPEDLRVREFPEAGTGAAR